MEKVFISWLNVNIEKESRIILTWSAVLKNTKSNIIIAFLIAQLHFYLLLMLRFSTI